MPRSFNTTLAALAALTLSLGSISAIVTVPPAALGLPVIA